jgi:APA family basic amino acid/polyamine antiporter
VLSFILAGVTCAFSALSYSELASSIPISGSAYTYAYATLGELLAWIIGWDLILEYGVSVAAVAVGWGEYLNELLDTLFGVTLPDAITQPPGDGGVVNIPAAFLVLAATVPLEVIFELVNIGTLFAFIIVNIGVIVLRRTRPDLPRGFRVPWVPVVPIIGALLCFYLMRELTVQTWLRFVGWLLAGLVLYFVYGRRHSRLQHGETVITEEE